MREFEFLEEQGVSQALIRAAEEFRKEYGVSEEAKHRLMEPAIPFYGKEILEMGMAAVWKERTFFWQGRRQLEKMCWQRIWLLFSGGRYIMYPSM